MIEEDGWITFTTSGMSLDELWRTNHKLFHSSYDRWWRPEPFANKKARPRKIKLLTSPLDGSINKTYREQRKLLGEGEYVPTVRELVDGMIMYYKVTGEHIFPVRLVRCSDVSSSGNRILCGHFSERGLYISGFWADNAGDHNFGLAVARRLS